MNAYHEETPQSLFLKIANDDEQAFAAVFDKYYSRIYSTSLQYCKVKEYAEDITQQVFILLWEQREALINIKNPEAWLWTVTRNQTL
ncbi:MAG: RNA polymerase sigma factor [Agriterribacter sp.]